jgi:hypothetical protein
LSSRPASSPHLSLSLDILLQCSVGVVLRLDDRSWSGTRFASMFA